MFESFTKTGGIQMKIITTSFLIFIALPLVSNADPIPDSIGIYLDYEGTISCGDSPYSPYYLYVLLQNPSNLSGIDSVHFRVEKSLSAGTFIIGWFVPQDTLDFGDNNYLDHHIVFGSPRFGDKVELLSINILRTDYDPDLFWVMPSYAASTASYVAGDLGVVDLNPSNGDFSLPSMTVDGDCGVVPVRETSWGDIKLLYR